MNYRDARIVLFPFLWGVEIAESNRSYGWIMVPPLVLQRTKIQLRGTIVHLKQHNVERELIILPFFPGYYETIMGKDLSWKDPINCFVNDVGTVLKEKDAVVWIYTLPKCVGELNLLFSTITNEFAVFNPLLEESLFAIADFPNAIAV